MLEITCTKCGTTIPANLAFKTSSLFFSSGYLPYCCTCLSSLIDIHNLSSVNKLFQYADWPFNPSNWMLLCNGKLAPEKVLLTYYKQYVSRLYSEGYNGEVDWTSLNNEWKKISSCGKLTDLLPEKQQEKEKALRQFWGDGDAEIERYNLVQLEYLDNLYHDLERTQNLTTGAQADQAKKLARLSLAMDIAEENKELELYVKLMGAYEKLVKVADFTPKNSQSSSSFESMGELVAFLEKTGFINKFYDGEQRDIVDKTIKSQQIFLRRIISGESNLSERIEQRLQRMNLLDRMEDGTTSEEEWSYELEKDDSWLDDGSYNNDDYTDPDEDEEFEVDE